MLLPILIGVALAIAFALLARIQGEGKPGVEQRVLALGLVIAALIYVAFAVVGRPNLHWHVVEVTGLAIFGLLAWWGARREPIWLAVGWAIHVGWDLGLHGPTETFGQTFVPVWYPALCVGFDVFVAGYILGRYASGALREPPSSKPKRLRVQTHPGRAR